MNYLTKKELLKIQREFKGTISQTTLVLIGEMFAKEIIEARGDKESLSARIKFISDLVTSTENSPIFYITGTASFVDDNNLNFLKVSATFKEVLEAFRKGKRVEIDVLIGGTHKCAYLTEINDSIAVFTADVGCSHLHIVCNNDKWSGEVVNMAKHDLSNVDAETLKTYVDEVILGGAW